MRSLFALFVFRVFRSFAVPAGLSLAAMLTPQLKADNATIPFYENFDSYDLGEYYDRSLVEVSPWLKSPAGHLAFGPVIFPEQTPGGYQIAVDNTPGLRQYYPQGGAAAIRQFGTIPTGKYHFSFNFNSAASRPAVDEFGNPSDGADVPTGANWLAYEFVSFHGIRLSLIDRFAGWDARQCAWVVSTVPFVYPEGYAWTSVEVDFDTTSGLYSVTVGGVKVLENLHFVPTPTNARAALKFMAPENLAYCLDDIALVLEEPSAPARPAWVPMNYPLWWYDEEPALGVPASQNDTESEANYVPVNLGQLKWMATRAKAYLDAQWVALGGSEIDLDAVFPPMPPPGEPGSPERATYEAAIAANYAPANLGQLKAVGESFYDKLAEKGFDTRAYLREQGYSETWAYPYPWDPTTPIEENYASANLGQLKLVFGFDLNALPGELPEWWQRYYFGYTGVSSTGDADMDGFTNLEEYLAGTNPLNYYNRPTGGPNLPPVVTVGEGLVILWPDHVVALAAEVSDPDAGPQELTMVWSKVSGPGEVVFANAQSPVTTAAFSQAGTYLLQLAATDGEATTAALLTVNILASPMDVPEVRFVAPESGAILDMDRNFALWIKAVDAVSGIATVDLYRNGQLIQSHAGRPLDSYLMDWTETALGAVTFTAVATNHAGVSVSANVSLFFYPDSVGPPPGGGGGENGTHGNGSNSAGGGDGGFGSLKSLPLPENGPVGLPSEFDVWTDEQEEITDERDYVGAPGQVILLEVVIISEEYPQYTSSQSEYDDAVSWSISPAWGEPKFGVHRVNELHEKFNEFGEAVIGYYAIRFPTEADPEKRKLKFKAIVQNIADGIRDSGVQFRVIPVDFAVTINTFIPQNNIEHPFNDFPLFRNTVFSGDDRLSGSPARATWDENGSHRTQQKLKLIPIRVLDGNGLADNSFDWDGDGVLDSEYYVHIGTTYEFDAATSLDASGNITAAARADTTLGDNHLKIGTATAKRSTVWVYSYTWFNDQKLAIQCYCESGNPLVTGAPAISYKLKITVDYTDPMAPTYSLEGSHDGFPAYEIYINGIQVYQYDPLESGKSVIYLMGKQDESISELNKPVP